MKSIIIFLELLDHLKGTLEGFQKNELDGGYGVYAQGKQLYKLLQVIQTNNKPK